MSRNEPRCSTGLETLDCVIKVYGPVLYGSVITEILSVTGKISVITGQKV